MLSLLNEIWPHIVGGLTLLVTLVASGHAVLNKRDARSAVAWVGVIWLVPVLGALLYLIFGINRIRRRAKALRSDQNHLPCHPQCVSKYQCKVDADQVLNQHRRFISLSRLVEGIVHKPLLQGNRITPLVNGDTAYPAMIRAIDGAEHFVTLSTYIFDNDKAGRLFLDALARAVGRGVDVRVLVDDVGARYSWPPMTRMLQRAGITVARFLPTSLPWRMPYINLRNHRKILVVDGKTGFTGGMNIRKGHMLMENPRYPVQDLHFQVEGPVVAHLQENFAEDWAFCTGESMQGEQWFPCIEPKGTVVARGIPDGPDEDFEKLLWTVHGALACARRSVRIVTPYFIPDSTLTTSLNLAAMRGVDVEIILPQENNLRIVKWASTSLLLECLEHGCRVWLTAPPFDHTKLMLVDDVWVLFGSANMDTRSFLLNFEFNVECYDHGLAAEMNSLIDTKLKNAHQVTLQEIRNRKLPVRLRDGVARLFSPYL
ncbi:Cardiolipin synthase, ClsA [hydrothermal vent metagenome]|uniref:Cardiolipin synthase, ClsA n=1 Tax=hydrothermal vent metagenome TaxID=652676 RepID=A0A3B1DCN1_9ZZZZ